MKDYKKMWMESVPLVLPVEFKKFDYVIDKVKVNCPTCHKELTNIRGKIYEAFDCVEADIVGVCHGCHFVIGHRSRYYPESGRCLMLGVDGWKEGVIISPWLDRIIVFVGWMIDKIKKWKNFLGFRGTKG